MANEKYSKIIDLPHPTSVKHKRMPVSDRAAQFAPFAALTGYGDAIDESGLLFDEIIELSEDMKAELDMKQGVLSEMLDKEPLIKVKYFVENQKGGGKYKIEEGRLVDIDGYVGELVFSDGRRIKCRNVYSIESDVLDSLI